MSFVHTISSTFSVPSFVIYSDVFGHQLCYQIDGREGAYLSVFPTPPVSLPLTSDTRNPSLTCIPSFTMADVDGKPLPPLPPPDYGHNQYGPLPPGAAPPMPVPVHHPEYDEYADDGEYYDPDDYGSPEYGMEYNRLSTITERTERSEYSKHYPSARQVVYRDSISSDTEYGAFRGAHRNTCNWLMYSRPPLQNRDSLRPLLHPHLLYPRNLIRSHPYPRRDNGMP